MGGAGGAGGGGIGGEGGGTGGAGGEGGGTGGAGGGTGGNAPGSVVIGVNTTPEELYVPGASLHLVIKVDGAVVQDKLFGTGIVEPIPLPQELKLVVGQGYSSFTPLENNGIADVYAGDQGMNISVEIMDKDGTKLTAEKPVTIATEPIY